MKIDKNTVDMLLKLPDEALWRMICTIASASGFDLSGMKVSHAELEKLRSALSQMNDGDISRAVDILNQNKAKRSD